MRPVHPVMGPFTHVSLPPRFRGSGWSAPALAVAYVFLVIFQ